MKEKKLIGTSSIPYKENCTIQVLNIKETLDTKHKKEERYYSDFYNVTDDEVYFIDRIELDPFCDTLGYQVINNRYDKSRLVIYNYDVVVGKKYHAVKKVFKYYDIEENININAGVSEIITELGFDLPDEDKHNIELADVRLKKMDEFIEQLDNNTELDGIIPLVNISKKDHQYTNKKAYSSKMIMPISRKKFASYLTELITKSDKNIIVNHSVINLSDYQKSADGVKQKIKKKDDK